MAQTLDISAYDAGRQDVLVAKATITFGSDNDGAATGTYRMIAVPAGAIVVGGYIKVDTATPASVDLHVGDGGSDARYKANVDGATEALTALVPTGYEYTSDDTIDVMVDTAAPASGAATVLVQYIVDGRAAFVQK